MTLPIALHRHAPEPPAPSGAGEATMSPDERRSFGRALDHAMHESPGAAREASAARRARASRPSAAGAVARESRQEPMRESAGAGEDDSVHAVERSGGRDDARRETPGEVSTMPTDREQAADHRIATDDARDDRGGEQAAVVDHRPSGESATPTRGAEEAVATDASDEALAQGNAPALDATFVAHALESAVAPPSARPTAGGAPETGATSPRDARPTASTMPGHGERSAAEQASVISLSSGVGDPALASARTGAIAAAVVRDPLSVRREVEGLNPELRARLERVVDRMEQEYGYTVEVVETLRSQERQDALYAQGRTAAGPVVTWTRQSKHLHGAAADVVIDGGYTNAAGFERLARVAREEGLRTLWPRDPGHIELPKATTPAGAEARLASAGASVAAPTAPADGTAAAGAASMPVAIPRAARAGVDPAAGRRAPEWPAHRGDGVRTLPITPESGDLQTLPFPMPDLQLPTGEADMRYLPQRPDLPGAMPVAGRRQLVVGASGGPTVPASPTLQAPPAISAQPATSGVARVASVAQVATVAAVARVATVAAVGGGRGAARQDGAVPRASDGATDASPTPAPLPGAVLAAPVIAADATLGRGSSGGGRRMPDESPERDAAERTASAPIGVPERESSAAPTFGRGEGAFDRSDRSETAPVAGLTRSDATERIARVLRLQEAAHDRPMTSVLLRLDHPEGGEDRIRIDLRGQTVGTTLDIGDPRAAEQLRAHAPELQQALQRQGLEGESMVVRTNSRTTDASALTASALAGERDVARAASATASDGGGSTARDTRNQPRAGSDRDGSDQQRSRQRRDGKGETR